MHPPVGERHTERLEATYSIVTVRRTDYGYILEMYGYELIMGCPGEREEEKQDRGMREREETGRRERLRREEQK